MLLTCKWREIDSTEKLREALEAMIKAAPKPVLPPNKELIGDTQKGQTHEMNVVKDMIAACEGLLRAHRLTFKRPPQTVEQAENELAEIHAAVATAEAAIQQAKDAPWVPDEAQLKAMVDRFLAWPVPNDFAPDAGISFVPPKPGSYGTHWWPIGTNLMTAEQAMQMFRNCTTPDSTPNVELSRQAGREEA